MSAKQKALVLPAKLAQFEIQERDVRQPEPGWLLVKIKAAALNPIDWKIQSSVRNIETFPAVIGIDGAGVVEAVGEGNVSGFGKGDRVLFEGRLVPPNFEHSTHQQYATVPAEIVAKIPENLNFDEAASVPLGLFTAALGLYNPEHPKSSAALEPFWTEKGRGFYKDLPIVIFGGASSVGQYAIQIARLSGFSPIVTTASLRSTELLTAFGATHVLDRNLSASSLLAEVRNITAAPIKVIYDAISLAITQNVAYEILAPGGQLILVLQPAVEAGKITPDKEIKNTSGCGWWPDTRKVSVSLWSALAQLLQKGEIKPNRVEVLPGELNGIAAGLDRLKNNEVSGSKLIVRPWGTT